MNIQTKIEKLEKDLKALKKQLREKNIEWVEINNKNCPTLKKYGAKPFKIMKRKMRDKDGKVWNNINFFDAKKECEKLGHRLPDIREMLALLEHYRKTQTKVSEHDKEFLGIEELSLDEDVYMEWVKGAGCAFLRGAGWDNTSDAGVFALTLNYTPSNSGDDTVGFRMCSDLGK